MKEKTRKQIIEVASQLFAKYGFRKTSMDEIARVAHKAKGSLYYHFESKEVLFTEVVSTMFEELKVELQKIMDDRTLTPIDKIKAYLRKRMDTLAKAECYHETIRADLFDRFEFVDSLREDLDKWDKNNLKVILQDGISAGYYMKMQNIDMILDLFFMVLKGLELPLFIQKKYTMLGPYFDDMLMILVRVIAVDPNKIEIKV